eukprot:TRINITY_DN10051_c1_g1_i1.p1 TRINITY_DN10051_c1_g1~~TRINITY_DN10051_c1_g1_i1.p1  ORF type:complete len:434 (+),score=133.97 TRINITY_DN10051_c1_g1_i1:101-1402(+)
MADFPGKLHVHVQKGRDFVPSVTARRDPYVVLELDKQKFKTKTLPQETNPAWNQAFTFNISKPFGVLEMSVWDEKKLLGSDEFLGKISIALADLSDQESFNKWVVLQKRTDADNVKGEVLVQVQYKYLPIWDPIYKGYQALKNKNYPVASRLLTESLARFPEVFNLYGLRSAASLGLGNFEDAMSDAQKITEVLPNSGEGYYRMGMVYFQAEEYDKAVEALQQGLKNDPDHPACLRGLNNMKKNDIKIKVRTAVARGRQRYDAGEYDLAIDYFSDAISLNPKNPTYYVYRSIAYVAAKNLATASEDAWKAITLDPNWPKMGPTKTGYLEKEGKVNIMMKKRWFILKDCFIFYFNTKTDLKPNGIILLGDWDLQKRKKLYFRVVTPGRTYEMKAETERERDEWLIVLEKILNMSKPILPEYSDQEDRVFLDDAG